MAKTFTDKFLGKCRYNGFYLVNDINGGYSFKCSGGSGASDFVDPEKVIKLAKSAGMKVHLAGGRWEGVGKKGWGQKVTPKQATELVEKLSKRQSSRGNKKWLP